MKPTAQILEIVREELKRLHTSEKQGEWIAELAKRIDLIQKAIESRGRTKRDGA